MSTKMVGPLLGLLSIAILLMHASVQAAPAAYRGTEEARLACTPDVFRLCGEFIPDATRITMCLQQKIRFLSSGCRAVFASPAAASSCATGRAGGNRRPDIAGSCEIGGAFVEKGRNRYDE